MLNILDASIQALHPPLLDTPFVFHYNPNTHIHSGLLIE